MFQRLTFNLSGGSGRSRELRGRKYYVVPAVMMAEGVWDGSEGAVYYPGRELAKACPAWNNKPIVNEHPRDGNGKLVTAATEAAKMNELGFLLNTRWEDGKQKTETWFDEEYTNASDPSILRRLKQGESVELSTGLYFDGVVPKAGRVYNGKKYDVAAKNHRPDHLAVLMSGEGAFSRRDGGGIGVNRKFTAKERGTAAKKGNALPDGSYPINNVEDLKNAIHAYGRGKNKASLRRHIVKRAKALGATGVIPAQWRGRAAANARAAGTTGKAGMSHPDVARHLTDALAARFGKPGKPWYGYVVEPFDKHVVFRDHPGPDSLDGADGQSRMWQIGYTRNDNGVELDTADPVRVERDTVYRQVGNEAPTPTEVANVALTKEQKAALVTNMVANSKGKWTEVDRTALEGLDEGMLQRVAAEFVANTGVAGGTPGVVPANVPAPTPSKSLTDFLSTAPPELQGPLQDMVANANAQKKQYIDVIVNCPRNVIPRDQLERAPLQNLKAMAQLVGPPSDPNLGGFAPLFGDGSQPIVANYAPAGGAAPANYATFTGNGAAPLAGNGDSIESPNMTFDNPLAARR